MPRTDHRARARRHGRTLAAATSVVVTGVTLLGGLGVLPTSSPAEASGERPSSPTAANARPTPVRSAVDPPTDPTALPGGSGHGRRVVLDLSAQRVWLVGASGRARRTYLVSGSVTDNLRPGAYRVWSTSRWAVGVDDSGVMQYFVRFAHGARAAIGFHSIPTKDGRALQTERQLGTPQSHGCVRQAMPDAKALWDFAPVGTRVVVLS